MRMSWMAVAVLLCSACADSGDDHSASANTQSPQTFAAQVELGQRVFADKCASCHGSSGQGTDKAPRLVGLNQGALPLKAPADRKVRHEDFVTAGDVASFVVMNMPADNPGSLSTEEYLAVLAFDLKANGIMLDQKLTLDLADTLTIPR